MSLLGLVYLPEPEFAAVCRSAAEELLASKGPRSVLRDDALAHVTIAHVRHVPDVEAAWNESTASLPGVIRVGTKDLYVGESKTVYNGDGTPDHLYNCGLAVEKSPELNRIEEATLAMSWVAGGELHSANRKRFFPHITLGTSLHRPDTPHLADVCGRSGVVCRLAMGPIGQHGVFQKIEFQAAPHSEVSR